MPPASADIVLVDDDEMVGEFARRVLRRSGRHLCVFADPLVALEHLAAHAPRVLIVDTRMPLLDGPELLVRLARHGRLEGVRVILCSAARRPRGSAPEDAAAALEGIERLSKDELFDARTLVARLGEEGAAPPSPSPRFRRLSGGPPPSAPRQPSSAEESSGRISNRSPTRP